MTGEKPDDPPRQGTTLSHDSAGKDPVILAVGRSGVEGLGQVIATPFGGLTADLLQQVRPDVVAFPLLGSDCDAALVVERLGQLNYAGLALVVAPRLPNPAMVLRELRSLMPSLRIEISQREG